MLKSNILTELVLSHFHLVKKAEGATNLTKRRNETDKEAVGASTVDSKITHSETNGVPKHDHTFIQSVMKYMPLFSYSRQPGEQKLHGR